MSNIALLNQDLPDFLQTAGVSELTKQLAGRTGTKRIVPKNGIVKVWWNDETDVVKESYKDLTEEELALLLSDGQMEIVSQEQNQVGEVPTMVPDAMGMGHGSSEGVQVE